MADVRTYAGVPTAAQFADMGAPFPGGSPIVINSLTGLCYVLVAGVVTLVGSTVTLPIVLTTDVSGVLPVANGGTGYAVRPAFLVYKTANQNNITGTGTVATVTWDAEAFDNGGDFASNTFTAPVTGKYILSTQVRFSGMTAAATSYTLRIVTSNRTYIQSSVGTAGTLLTGPCVSFSVLADMDINDTATVAVNTAGEASDVVDVLFGSTGNEQTFFSGYLAA